LSTFQISHACAVLLSTLLSPLLFFMFNITFYGGSIGDFAMIALILLMFYLGPIFLVVGPLVGIVVHYKVRFFHMKLIVYLKAGILCGGLFYLVRDNGGGDIWWYLVFGLFAGLVYFLIQFSVEAIVRKFKFDY